MSGCDTLIVENGYYYDSLNINTANLSGNVNGTGCYTTIEAATPWTVTVDSSKVSPTPNATVDITEPYIQVIGIKAASNPDDAGLAGAGYPWMVYETNHVKLQKTAGYNAPCATTAGSNWNMDVYAIGPGSSYVLVEDSHAWGCGRYKFLAYQSDHVIFRRDVSRHDYAGGLTQTAPSNQVATFTTYDSQYTLFQNDIAIDSGLVNGETGNLYGGWWSEHNDGAIDNPIEVEGSIVDNVMATASWQDAKQAGLHTFVNDASVNSEGGAMIGPELQSSTIIGTAVTSVTLGSTYATVSISPAAFVETGNHIVFSGLTGTPAVLNGPTQYTVLSGANDVTPVSTFTVNYSSASPGGPYSTGGSFLFASGMTLPTTSLTHMTIANVTGTTLGNYVDNANGAIGIGVEGTSPLSYYTSQTVADNIFQNITSGGANTFAVSDWVTPNYNYYYENAANLGSTVYQGYTPTAGANDVQGVNPQIKYITREEPGTPVYGTASDGGNIGATILYEIGTTGTLYGDPGYDTVTSTSLWPFPNEAVIKSDMATFSMTNPITGNAISGMRGFAAPGNGLYGGPITLTSYIWEALGNACPAGICP
jgi:hypothetical protein